jgi:methylmalonyl-CoA mutase N-terminal domain/subunit
MPVSIACAKAGVTTGEWGQRLREAVGMAVEAGLADDELRGLAEPLAEIGDQQAGFLRREGRNIMPVSIACAKAGVTTGEWGQRLREVFGEYRRAATATRGCAARPPSRPSRRR